MTNWTSREQPSTNRTGRQSVSTSWNTRIKPNTSWDTRTQVSTERSNRQSPTDYIAPLQDFLRIVCDQDNEPIYIYSNTGKAIPGTRWTKRSLIS